MGRHVSYIVWQALRAEVAELRGMAASAEADLRSAQEVGGSGSAPAPGELEELRDMAQAEAAELLAQARSLCYLEAYIGSRQVAVCVA